MELYVLRTKDTIERDNRVVRHYLWKGGDSCGMLCHNVWFFKSKHIATQVAQRINLEWAKARAFSASLSPIEFYVCSAFAD